MKIVAFLQLYNELEKGNLIRCLENCKKWSDEIVIYDDNSTDGSYDVYLKYTERDLIISGKRNEFKRELFHKKELLDLTKTLNPDWIGWIDGDAIFDKILTENLKDICSDLSSNNIDGAFIHNLNLWKDESWYRTDSQFNDLFHCCLWRNSEKLHYNPIDSLHQQQYPYGMSRVTKLNYQLIHYGFSSREKIIEKYLRYKGLGQNGWDLDRLIYEGTEYTLYKVPKDIYPIDIIPSSYDISVYPKPEDYNEIRNFNCYSDYKTSMK